MSLDHFNPAEYNPVQNAPKHPVGKFPARITNTEVIPIAGNKGMYVKVSFETPQGRIHKNYNIQRDDAASDGKAAENQTISRNQFSALHYACNMIGGSSMRNQFRELVNAQLVIEVSPQANDEKYNEVSCVYDMRGELPKAQIAPGGVPQFGPVPQHNPNGQAPAPMQQPLQPPNHATGQFSVVGGQNANAATGYAPSAPPPNYPAPPFNQGQAPAFQPAPTQPAPPPFNPAPNQPAWNQGGEAPAMPAWATPQQGGR